MNEHIHTWLEAYHDGSLKGSRLQQVEDHLASCAECRTELENLQALSDMLQEVPPPGTRTPPERFVSQVMLRLPRQQERPGWRVMFRIGWQAVPFGLFGAWVFVQTVFIVTGLVLLGLQTGAGRGIFQSYLPVLDHEKVLIWGAGLVLATSAVIGLLFLSWLATWWVGRQHQQTVAVAGAGIHGVSKE